MAHSMGVLEWNKTTSQIRLPFRGRTISGLLCNVARPTRSTQQHAFDTREESETPAATVPSSAPCSSEVSFTPFETRLLTSDF